MSGDSGGMAAAAPRIGATLLAAVERLDDESLPIAEVHRRVGALASHLGYARPSYEQTRVLVHEHRRRGLAPTAGRSCSTSRLKTRPPHALLELLEATK